MKGQALFFASEIAGCVIFAAFAAYTMGWRWGLILGAAYTVLQMLWMFLVRKGYLSATSRGPFSVRPR